MYNEHMRLSLERSAEAWTARANLLERLEAKFNARAKANSAEALSNASIERKVDGQRTKEIRSGASQAEGHSAQKEQRIKHLEEGSVE